MSSASLQLGGRSRAAVVGHVGWRGLLPVLLPCGLLVAGGLQGYPNSLDIPIARERLFGLIVASSLAVVASVWLKRLDSPAPWLISMTILMLFGSGWVISVSGPDVFRGVVGRVLQTVFRPVFGLAQITDPVEVSNTRFIVGYNGLTDLCLVAIFSCGALLIQRPWPRRAPLLVAVIALNLVLLVGTGARGGLTGLAAGICAVGLFAWPRRYALLAVVAAPLALAVAALGVLDKGLEFSSTSGRLTYWGDLARMLVEYPLTGVGLGVDTANAVALLYEINPDPDRIFYAHNTFVQSYLEQGPLGALGMLLVPVIAVAAALIARRHDVASGRRTLMLAGLGIVGSMEAHGLTDQVVTTNVGTGLLLLGLAGVLAALSPSAQSVLAGWTRRTCAVLTALAAVVVVGVLLAPSGRAQVLLDLGGLEVNQALAMDTQAPERGAALADAESMLSFGLSQDPGHPALLRELALVRASRYDDIGALAALRQAVASSRLDAFDLLQIAHLYRDLGFTGEAYSFAARAYAAWGRPPEDAVMQVYAQSTLTDSRARTVADQAEAAMRGRAFARAHALFQQALTFQPDNAYLLDRIGAAQRAIDKYGG